MDVRAGGDGPRARGFLVGAGVVLILLGVAGIALAGETFGRFFSGSAVQGTFHGALGLAAIGAALVPRWRPRAALALAIVLLGLGVVGTLSPRLFGYPERLGSQLRWEVGENAAHLLLGGWGAYVATREERNED